MYNNPAQHCVMYSMQSPKESKNTSEEDPAPKLVFEEEKKKKKTALVSLEKPRQKCWLYLFLDWEKEKKENLVTLQRNLEQYVLHTRASSYRRHWAPEYVAPGRERQSQHHYDTRSKFRSSLFWITSVCLRVNHSDTKQLQKGCQSERKTKTGFLGTKHSKLVAVFSCKAYPQARKKKHLNQTMFPWAAL